MKKVCYLALIELTTLYDVLVLLEQDQRKVRGTQTSLIFQKLIFLIEDRSLETDGLLRIAGAKQSFMKGLNWETVKQPDAASLLKLFICELSQPLLSVEYLKAFQAVQILPIKKQQQALNLLVVLQLDTN
ncbi:hypothetical protein QTO34_014263 [Cnephaeus nilssonii]|uniref:Rho-GAP domain-containing protein n=1 Tax=Cnephaeus nilssonii TaxID=3371016 RepID=A0AA40LS42_CNENI|nr:hypothetical protein QTO34_014263 [Eptesicus nilssonii]